MVKFFPLTSVIWIGGRGYKTVYDDKILIDSHHIGEADHDISIIKIYPFQGKEEKIRTWWHEVEHCKDRVFNQGRISKDEDQIDALAEADYQLMPQLGIEICFDAP